MVQADLTAGPREGGAGDDPERAPPLEVVEGEGVPQLLVPRRPGQVGLVAEHEQGRGGEAPVARKSGQLLPIAIKPYT